MRLLLFLCISVLLTSAFAQAPGDNVFGEDQILKINLEFSEPDFWAILVANYDTETYMAASVTITTLAGISTYPEIGIRLKGNSSYSHPGNKKSFKIDFNLYSDSLEYDGLKKLNFNNCFKDPTFMRENIFYSICKADNINAPRTNYANVYMNGTFWGFYSVVEQVNDEFLKTHFDDKSENLFKAGDAFTMGGGASDEADLQFYGTNQTDYENKYTLENNTDENNWSDLIDLVDFIKNSSDADFAAELSNHFNISQLMKSLALSNFFANLDSYLNSARNYYIYNKDSTGVWEWINWDCNEAFGSYTAGVPGDMTTISPYYYALDRPLLERILTIPETKEIYNTYYCNLANTYLTESYINARIDELYDLIQPSVYADGNKMYTNAQFDLNITNNITTGGGPGGGTIYGLQSFVVARSAYLVNTLDCSNVSTADKNIVDENITLYPNPVINNLSFDGTDLKSSAHIIIYNMQGEVVISVDTGNHLLDVSHLKAGMYLFTIQNGNEILSKYFVKIQA